MFSKYCFYLALISKTVILAWGLTPILSSAHEQEKEIEKALAVFEKAALLSPDLLTPVQHSSLIPFYKVGKHKIYLDQGFWELTRAWLRIYIEEIEKYCPCDVDPDTLIREAKNYIPQSFVQQKFVNPGRKLGTEISYQGAHITAKYGKVLAGLKLSAEVAETILSVFMGIKGVHILCNAIDALIIPLVRGFQKYTRAFSHGKQMQTSSSLVLLKTVWLSRQIRIGQKRIFFHIDQALEFRETELKKINAEGPKSLFKQNGHRLIWIQKLKTKTDPLFEKIHQMEQELIDVPSAKRKKWIEKQLIRTRNEIEKLTKVNRKDFFGARFKRFLLLTSRKARTSHMVGHKTPDKIVGKGILWPLSLQENVLERVLSNKTLSKDSQPQQVDLIREGLIEEFLSSKKDKQDKEQKKKEQSKVVRFFLADIEKIFDTDLSAQERLVRVHVLEMTLGALFSKHLKLASKILSNTHQMSFKESLKIQWAFGRFFYFIYDFSDFLSSVSVIKNKTKILPYKYESMEKLMAFFNYLHEVQALLKDKNLDKENLFARLQKRQYEIKTIALSKEKSTSFSFVPFKKALPKCKNMVEIYQ